MMAPTEVVRSILDDPTNPDVVHRLVAPDATYVSLSFDNSEDPDGGTVEL